MITCHHHPIHHTKRPPHQMGRESLRPFQINSRCERPSSFLHEFVGNPMESTQRNMDMVGREYILIGWVGVPSMLRILQESSVFGAQMSMFVQVVCLGVMYGRLQTRWLRGCVWRPWKTPPKRTMHPHADKGTSNRAEKSACKCFFANECDLYIKVFSLDILCRRKWMKHSDLWHQCVSVIEVP